MHGSEDHDHGTEGVSDGGLIWAVIFNVGLTLVELIAGIISGSLSLIADAAHNFSDAGALLIAWIARKIARKGADDRYTFGYRRAELIGAMINLTTLIVVGLMLIWQAIERLISPSDIDTTWVFIAAGVALVVDIATVVLLWAMSKGNLNIRAAFIHNLTDAAASVAVIVGAVAIKLFGWLWVDPVLTLLIACYILGTSIGMLRRTAAILMNNAPPDVDLEELHSGIESLQYVLDIHHIHVWELDERRRSLEAHIVLEPSCTRSDTGEIRTAIRAYLHDEWDIGHATLEVETPADNCPDASSYYQATPV